ncbi:MAG: hypothetical protein CMJ64_29320 [Planctomycetaceae bacterium]|nr:hypothetical protein [Planctomycetaceae bacterium]
MLQAEIDAADRQVETVGRQVAKIRDVCRIFLLHCPFPFAVSGKSGCGFLGFTRFGRLRAGDLV